jgi:hypothetical protein
LLLLLVSQHSGIVILLCASVEQWRELNLFGPQLMQQVTASAVMHQVELWHDLIHNGNWWIILNKHRNMLEWYFKNVGSGILLSEVPYKRPLFDCKSPLFRPFRRHHEISADRHRELVASATS